MPLPLIAHVPSTARSLYTLDEDEQVPSAQQQKIGLYTLVEHLGAGSSGSSVFAATRPDSRTVFAVKVLRGGSEATACAQPRFVRESELTCQLEHPHVASGIEFGVDSGDHFLVMKLLRGKSLEEMLQDCGRLDWKTATKLMLHLARALAHLESLGIIHRDVKPENIMITKTGNDDAGGEPLVHSSCNGAAALFPCEDWHAVLIDMGLARRAAERPHDVPEGVEPSPSWAGGMPGSLPEAAPTMRRVATPAWSAIGSPGFMAPEQIRDARSAGHAADVYGLGTTWYAVLAGTLPFSASTPHKTMQQCLHSDVQPISAHLPDVPKAVEALLHWILQREPRVRPPCGPYLVAQMEAVLAAPHDAQRVLRAREAHERRRRRQDMLSSCLHAAALSVGGLLFAWLAWDTLMLPDEPGGLQLS